VRRRPAVAATGRRLHDRAVEPFRELLGRDQPVPRIGRRRGRRVRVVPRSAAAAHGQEGDDDGEPRCGKPHADSVRRAVADS
jgi:hypothetical protein